MMTPAYEETYLNDAMDSLGNMMDYAVNDCGQDPDIFFTRFIASGLAENIERGNPKYVGGMSGVELATEVFRRVTGVAPQVPANLSPDKNAVYWAGWALAYYQWRSGLRFRDLAEGGLTFSKVLSMYILHEADISKFVEAANKIVGENLATRETNLKRIRKAKRISQKELADRSGVTLRMVQLYEQRQNDINKARGSTLQSLARTLSCEIEDLLEPELPESQTKID